MNERYIENEIADDLAKRFANADPEVIELLETETAKWRSLAGERRKRAGRKPKPANKLRSHRLMVRLNDEELRIIGCVASDDVEFAAAVRELALEAASARLAAEKTRIG